MLICACDVALKGLQDQEQIKRVLSVKKLSHQSFWFFPTNIPTLLKTNTKTCFENAQYKLFNDKNNNTEEQHETHQIIFKYNDTQLH